MDNAEIEIYKQTKTEIIERIKLRTQINHVKMIVIGGIFAICFKHLFTDSMPYALHFFICVIAFCFDLSIHHNAIYINRLGDYLVHHLEPHLIKYSGSDASESWESILRKDKTSIILDFADRVGYILITLTLFVYSSYKILPSEINCWKISVFMIFLFVATFIELFLTCLTLKRRKT